MRGPPVTKPALFRRWGASLPMVTALACGFFLAVWVANLVGGVLPAALTGLFPPSGGTGAAPATAVARNRAEADPPADPFLASGLFGMEPAAGPGAEEGTDEHEAGDPGEAPAAVLDGIAGKVPAELADVAARLVEKEKRLEARRRELEVEEEVLTKLRDDLDGQIARLEELKQEIAGLLEQLSAEEEARLDKLVAIYEAMKPKQAAAIFDRLELPVLLKVTRRMRETKLAPILARMDPARARQITTELSAAPELPRLE